MLLSKQQESLQRPEAGKTYPFSHFSPYGNKLQKQTNQSDPFEAQVKQFKEEAVQIGQTLQDLLPGNNRQNSVPDHGTTGLIVGLAKYEPGYVWDGRKADPSLEKTQPLPGYQTLYHMFGYSKQKDPVLYKNLTHCRVE
jgi:hypothetical protein